MSKLRWWTALLVGCAFLPSASVAQERVAVAGTVVEAGTQRPLAGAQVTVPAARAAIVTDAAGRFALSLPRGAHTVRVALIGYRDATRQITAGEATGPMTIELAADPLRLDEMIVTGYTQERRRNVTGAITSVKPEQVTREVPVLQVNEILRGRAPGVAVYQNSGMPGAAMSVRVRGSSSISGGNDPLYVIDGVPLTQGNYTRIGTFGGQTIDALGDIGANEIESIEILKDASAAAIYGSRASNGVVLITTKKGHTGRPEMNFGAYYGNQRDWRRIGLLNAAQYTEIYNEGCMARFSAPCVGFTDDGVADRIEAVRGADTDWLSEVLRTAPMSQMDGSIRGGNDRVKYYVSGSMLDQEGTQKALGYAKLNARVNLDYQPYDKFTVGTNVALARSVTRRSPNDNTIVGAFANAIAMAPTVPVRNADGTYATGFYLNPVGINNLREAEERAVRILGNAFANYSLFEGVTLRAAVGLDHYNLRGADYTSPVYLAVADNGRATATDSYVTKNTYEGTLNFNRILVPQHEVSGVVGSSFEDNVNSGSSTSGTGFPNEFFKYLGQATITSGSSSRIDWGLVSFFGRLTYTWRDKVTTSFNARRDGSSKFGANNKYGTFPSASLNWRIGDESFMQAQNIISNLSLRASYGVTGNQQALGEFSSRALFSGGQNYQDQPGIAPSQLGNPELRWEKTKQTNLGTDFAVLRDRLKFAIDYYVKHTDDLLVNRPVPRTTGFSSITSNVGSMENRGIDLGITADLLKSSRPAGLNLTSSLSVSRNRNKVLELYNDQPILGSNAIEEGRPLGFFRGYIADGIFQTMAEVQAHAVQTTNADPRRATGPGDMIWRDINGRDAAGKLTGQPDGVINADDQTMIGNPWPDYEGGLSNTASFKGFDLNAFIQFSVGNDVYNGQRIYQDRFGSDGDNHTQRAMKRWRPDHTDTNEPRAIWGDPNGNASKTSSRMVEDGSYLRLKNVTLGYRLPEWLAGKAGARNARIYVQGQNLITKTNYSGFDPEVNSSSNSSVTRGYDFYALPQARVYMVGFNFGF